MKFEIISDSAQIAKLLDEAIPDAMKALLMALQAADEPEPVGPQAEDLRELLGLLEKELVQELHLYASLLGAADFQARALTYAREARKKSVAWSLADVEYAAARVLSSEPASLRAVMDHNLEKYPGGICLWVTSVTPGRESPLFLVVARHADGLEQLYLLSHRRWTRLPVGDKHRDSMIRTCLGESRRDRSRWAQLSEQEASALAELTLTQAQGIDAENGAAPLDSRQWQALVRIALTHDFHVQALQDISRYSASSPLRESHRMMEVATRALLHSLEQAKEKHAQLSKDHARANRRLKSDFDKLQLAYSGLSRRTKSLETENAELKRQVQPRPGSNQGQATPLPLRLDALFPALPR